MSFDIFNNNIVHQEDKYTIRKLKHITAHKEPIIEYQPNYKVSWCNIMVEWNIWETTTERLYIITVYEPFICDFYVGENNLLLTVPSTPILRCKGVTLNYPVMKFGKELIHEYFH